MATLKKNQLKFFKTSTSLVGCWNAWPDFSGSGHCKWFSGKWL